MAHQGRLRRLRHSAADAARLVDQGPDRLLLLLPGRARAGIGRHLVAGALAVGPRLYRAARERDPRRLARRRHAALHADGVRHRLGARRHRWRAVRAADPVHRAERVQPQPVAEPPADGDGRRLGLFSRPVSRRGGLGAAARVVALRQRGAVPHLLRRGGDGADGVLSLRPARARREGVPQMNAVLEVRGLEKAFGGIRAVNGVSFEVREGEILGLIGPNGSGKSTLFNCILGQLTPSAGEVRIDGRAITGKRPCQLNRLGVGRTFQLLQVFPQLTVRENLILAGQEHQASMWSRLVGRRDAGLGPAADRMIEFFRLTQLAQENAGSLSYGQQKLLDVAMAFMAGPRLVLLDEPAGGVNPTMLAGLRERLREINATRRATFVVIEHNMEFVMSLCTRVLVLAEGRIIAEGTPDEVRANPAVIEAYLGG